MKDVVVKTIFSKCFLYKIWFSLWWRADETEVVLSIMKSYEEQSRNLTEPSATISWNNFKTISDAGAEY